MAVESSAPKAGEVRVTAVGRLTPYVRYAIRLLKEEERDTIKIVASGQAIPKAVNVAETLKRRVRGLYQQTELSAVELQETLDRSDDRRMSGEKEVTTRMVSLATITMSTKPLDSSKPGYQEPLPDSEVDEVDHDGRSEDDDYGETARYGGDRRGKGGRKGAGKGFRRYQQPWDYYDGYYYYFPVGKGKGWQPMGEYYYTPRPYSKGKGKGYGKGAPRVRYW
ncbi:ribonuclease P MRP 25kDa [Perkinsus olseni]|uniref:Ribonuclease P MRP 25kDa n=1 Tax=Perkinsus olseni TaxID=32597 RepID=A0A7J6NRQ8_PEROL|nr:ribonuclease P MRP 25kDa [Perkinsus olseni]